MPDTGHGCGCGLCEDSGAPRYERRIEAERSGGTWGTLRREVFRRISGLDPFGRAQTSA